MNTTLDWDQSISFFSNCFSGNLQLYSRIKSAFLFSKTERYEKPWSTILKFLSFLYSMIMNDLFSLSHANVSNLKESMLNSDDTSVYPNISSRFFSVISCKSFSKEIFFSLIWEDFWEDVASE